MRFYIRYIDMSEIDEHTDSRVESWQDDTSKELNQLKKEMIGRVVDKMEENDKGDAMMSVWKDMVVDYLLDEWESSDKVNDFFLWVGINLFSNSADKLKDLRESIRKTSSKEELDNLERSIMENLGKKDNWQSQTTSLETSQQSSSGATDTSWAEVYDTDSSVDSAKVWEAKEVPLKQRMKWLFPQWAPKEEKEMKKYLTKIKVPIRTPEWKSKKLTLHIHKKLANEYKAIFQEMYDRWIPVNPSSTWWYNRRKMRRGSKLSHHSYWTAVDVNWDVNGWVYGATVKNSPYYNDQATVDIWKKHGFYRWWDWSSKSNDPMHFTYMNG